MTNWPVAVEERRGQDKRTIWFDCSLWGRRGEALAQYLRKGGKVSVSGELSTREHEGKTYLTVRVSEATLQGDAGGRRDGSGGRDDDRDQRRDDRGYEGGSAYGGRTGGAPGLDDEIPFVREDRA